MHWPRLRNLLTRRPGPSPPPAAVRPPRPAAHSTPPSPETTAAPDPELAWPPSRLAVTNALWGEGFQFPGGELETLRLARPLGLSAASSLLLVGAGSGGPPCSVANHMGVWVTGYETDATLAALASERSIRSGLGRRATIESWDPDAPDFGHSYFHHGMAFEPLGDANPESVLTAIVAGLKPGGQLTLIQTVADIPLDPQDPVVEGWARLEFRRSISPPTPAAVTRMLGRLGFDVRIVEDISSRHMQQALFGWRRVVGDLEQVKLTARQAGPLVTEAERWLLQLRLFQAGKLRRVRWHAIGRVAG